MIPRPTPEVIERWGVLNEANHLMRDGEETPSAWVEAYAKVANGYLGKGLTSVSMTPGVAKEQLTAFYARLLARDQYLDAAALTWGFDRYDPRPYYSTMVFESIRRNQRCILMGCSSSGKTFNAGVYMLLDMDRDPSGTAIKLCSVSEDHLLGNLFAHCVDMWQSAVLHTFKAKTGTRYLGPETPAGVKNCGVACVLVPQDKDGRSSLKGYKVRPRRIAHPELGSLTRLRILIDEAQSAAGSVYNDFPSILAGGDEQHGSVRVVLCGNPTDRTSLMVEAATPPDGWSDEHMESGEYVWTSRTGWSVTRLDGLLSENITEGRDVFRAIIGQSGWDANLADGPNSAKHYWANRGYPPMSTGISTFLSVADVNDATASVHFIDRNPVTVAACDPSQLTTDNCIMAVGRYGLADGTYDENGDVRMFEDPSSETGVAPRYVLQVEQIIPFAVDKDATKVVAEVIRLCREQRIDPEFLAFDETINSIFVSLVDAELKGILKIKWSKKATDMPVVQDDATPASARFDNIITEMWWTTREWVKCGAMYFSPTLRGFDKIKTQLTTRRYNMSPTSRIIAEKKKAYKARSFQESPDEADAIIMLTMLVRQRHQVMPSAAGRRPVREPEYKTSRRGDSTTLRDVLIYAPQEHREPIVEMDFSLPTDGKY